MMENALQEFRKLIETLETLLGPQGCPWDREQTLVSLRGSVLEEACEVIEAIDEEDDVLLEEELGDLFFNVLFFCKLGEKEKRFSTESVLKQIREKLISRHPHVFGEIELTDANSVLEQWERLKREEKKHRESVLDGIPKGLPALARAFKMAGKMEKSSFFSKNVSSEVPEFTDEDELGKILWEIAFEAKKRGINPENALRKELLSQEELFRKQEKTGN